MRLRSVLAAGVLALGTVVGVLPGTASAAPAFQLPFPCGQTWSGNSGGSSAHQSYEIDFNRGVQRRPTGTTRSSRPRPAPCGPRRNQGSANGYGNLVKIEHAGSYFTYYAHLSTMAVVAGQVVTRGQSIGTVGNTSKPGNGISPHLHYEVRLGATGYPGNIQRAVFNGATFGYPNASVTSRNCSDLLRPGRGVRRRLLRHRHRSARHRGRGRPAVERRQQLRGDAQVHVERRHADRHLRLPRTARRGTKNRLRATTATTPDR